LHGQDADIRKPPGLTPMITCLSHVTIGVFSLEVWKMKTNNLISQGNHNDHSYRQ